MKKITTVFAFMLLAFAFTSCDSATSDAKRVAQIECEASKLIKDGGYSKNEEKLTKLKREKEDITDKYKKKTENMSKSDKEELEKKMERAYEDEAKKCKD